MQIDRISGATTHWDQDGHWTGEPGAVFLALAQGESFRGGGMTIIGHAETQDEADEIIKRHVMQNTKTIVVTWISDKGGILVARCDEDHTLNSNTVRWADPITAKSDSWAIAHAVTEINGAEIISVDHDKDTVMVTVDGSVLAE